MPMNKGMQEVGGSVEAEMIKLSRDNFPLKAIKLQNLLEQSILLSRTFYKIVPVKLTTASRKDGNHVPAPSSRRSLSKHLPKDVTRLLSGLPPSPPYGRFRPKHTTSWTLSVYNGNGNGIPVFLNLAGNSTPAKNKRR